MTRPPNIVFLFSDQHAGPAVGAAGDPIADTPNIDRIAADGLLFENCYCPSPLCIPSRMAFMSGQYPNQIGVRTNRDYLPSDIPTYAHALAAAGYRTTLAGRMHFVGPDQLHGFEERLVGDISINWPGSAVIDFGAMNVARGLKGSTLGHAGWGELATHRYDEAVTAAALGYLDERGAEASEDAQPFFLGVGWYGPHPPFICDEQDYRFFEGRVPPAKYPKPDLETEHPFVKSWRERGEFDAAPEGSDIIARTAYYGMIRMIDRYIGRILQKLEASGLLENTIIVYTSDHGEQMGERGLWQKSAFFDHSVNIPLVMAGPGLGKGGERVRQNVSLIDLAQTFTALGGADALPNSPGVDLTALQSIDPANERPTFSEFYGGLVSIEATAIVNRMVRAGKWKLNYYHGYRTELFDMDADPDERVNLADKPEHQQTHQRLLDLLLENWNPDVIDASAERKAKNIDILKKWTQATNAEEDHRWFDPEPENNWSKVS